MNLRLFKENQHLVIWVAAILFFCLSVFFHAITEYAIYRLLRALFSVFLLGCLLLVYGKKINKMLCGFLIFISSSSLCFVGFENNFFSTLAILFNTVSYGILIWALIPKMDRLKMNSYFLLSFCVIVLVNGFLLFYFIRMIGEMSASAFQFSFMVLNTIGIITASFLTVLYNYLNSSKASMFFTIFVFALIFSEVFRAMGYYDILPGSFSVYISRALFITSLSFLLEFDRMKKTSEEELLLRH